MNVIVQKAKRIVGEIELPGDKSITHRAIIFGSISNEETLIINYSKGKDCLSTLTC
ncbi:MAG: 3-phosphoshikimate 1-carboxyvinyltransferase, partial [bacterium]|nr:3-phosphoshikimate 1-carboxyvinyltransferase [bacterium]MDW8164205.1 3-phosphoshikimate 1-carboxyvinyltransferase [Candidatus Omnitrophota bacterium]